MHLSESYIQLTHIRPWFSTQNRESKSKRKNTGYIAPNTQAFIHVTWIIPAVRRRQNVNTSVLCRNR